jgi:hypothetical protein
LTIKTLDPQWIRIRICFQPKMLDPDPEFMNPDPKHCTEFVHTCLKLCLSWTLRTTMPLVPEAEQTVEVWMLNRENPIRKGDEMTFELWFFANV